MNYFISKTEILYQVDPGFMCKYVGSFIWGWGKYMMSIYNKLSKNPCREEPEAERSQQTAELQHRHQGLRLLAL